MPKFRIKMKLQGLELEIEGEREEASLISRNLGQQLTGLMGPVGGIIEGEANQDAAHVIDVSPNQTVVRKSRKRRSGSTSGGDNGTSEAVDFRHDPEKYGMPRQDWKTAEKAVWLLYVAKEIAGIRDLSTRTIVETFNKHFRQAGTVTTSNVTRDLGRLKTKEKPSPVGEDTTTNPSRWFLTEEGNNRGRALVAIALGQ